MTTYQDPPLQSRRAARQGDRPESSTPPFTPPQLPRNAAGAGEPLSYVTQNRPPLPGYEGSAAPGRRAAQPEPVPVTDPPTATFRPRDFSPEARTAPPAWAPEYDRESGVVDYHTQARANVAPAAASLAESLSNEPNEQTLTRRELRQIRDAAHITSAPTDATPVVPPQPSAPAAPAPAPSATLDSAMAEFDSLASRSAGATAASPQRRGGRRAAPAAAPEQTPAGFGTAQPEVTSQQGLQVAAPAPQQVNSQQGLQVAAPAFQQVDSQQGLQVAAPVPPQVVSQQGLQVAAPQQPAFAQPAPHQPAPPQQPAAPQPTPQQAAPAPLVEPAAPAPVAPTTGERPVGHWTTQAELDDATQVADSTISRTIGAGSGAITTSALVLPSLPGQDMTTGEVMLTGSINLPSSLAATGAHTPLDESDLDHLLDPGDHQLVNTDSVPIRAIKAVSSHTGARAQLIGTGKPPKNGGRALTALIVSASVMVVVVVTLLVVAIATDVL